MLVSRAFVSATIAAAALAVVVLFILVYYAAYHGVSQWSGSFFTSQLPAYGGIGGGGGIGPGDRRHDRGGPDRDGHRVPGGRADGDLPVGIRAIRASARC